MNKKGKNKLKTEKKPLKKKVILHSNQDKFKLIYEHINLGISLIDRDMRIFDMNPKMREWFPHINVDKKPFCYESLDMPPRKNICPYCPAIKALRRRKICICEKKISTRDGIRNFRLTAIPIKDITGNVQNVMNLVEDITERKKAREQLLQQIDELFTILDTIEASIYVADIKTHKILRVNSYVEKVFGNNIIGKKCYRVLQKGQDKPCAFCTNDRLLIDEKPGPPIIWDYQNSKTGQWCHCIDRAILWPDGRFVRMEIAIDITERKKAEIDLKKSGEFLNTIFDSINDPFNIIDRNFLIIKANESYAQMRGKTVKDLIGNRCYEVLQNRKDICEECSVKETFDTGKPYAKEKLVSFPGGTHAWIEIYTHPVFDEKGEVANVIEYTRDVTKRKRAEAERDIMVDKLQYLSRTDELTGLLNRRALIERLEDEVRRTQRYNTDLTVLICDLDYFKEINDQYGHDTGDKVLQIVSQLLKESIRNTDTIGRYGGDEFLIILPETSIDGAKEIAERIRYTIENFELKHDGEEIIKTTVSLGVAQFSADTENIKNLIKRADNALYVAKGKGRNRVYLVEES